MQATLQSIATLEQWLHQAEERKKDEAAQHQAQLKNKRHTLHIYLEGLLNIKVQAHKQANAALQQAHQDQARLKGEAQDLSTLLKATLDQIHNIFVDLAAMRSLLDAKAQARRQQDAVEASTYKGQIDQPPWGTLSTIFTIARKGKKVPSEAHSRKAPNRTNNKKAPSRGPSLSLYGHEDTDAGASSSSSEDIEDGSKEWRFLKARKDHSCGDCVGLRGCGSNALAAQVRFDIKPKDPPLFTGKPSDDVEVGSN